ncbi:MAG: hypothetical protein JKY08_00615 [Flavobacteriaceae bacterium]|nr:hypothetical protein [Flavobacteriaceae bacterium]
MIFTGLKRKMLQSFFDKKQQENRNKNRVNGTCKIVKIGVLLTDKTEKTSVITDLTKTFGFTKNQLTFLEYKPAFEIKKEGATEGVFGDGDFGWFGAIKNPSVAQFVQTDFDLLINYSPSIHLYIDTLVLLSNASFKVSHAGINDELYDLVVATGLKEVGTLNQETKKYLQILNKL